MLTLSRFAHDGIDLLIIAGGDGTVRDVLTMGHSVFGQNWPTLAILPSGKTNALAHDLEIPDDWSLLDVLRAQRCHRTTARSPMVVTPLDEPDAAPALGFVLGGGVFTRAIELGQTAHRWGAFDALAVATTTCCSLARCFFGELSDPWRQGSAMSIALGGSREPLARSCRGTPSHRQIFLASALYSLPAKLAPFGKPTAGLKALIVDQMNWRSIVHLPALLTGKAIQDAASKGIHRFARSSFEIETADHLILDGEALRPGRYLVHRGPDVEFLCGKTTAANRSFATRLCSLFFGEGQSCDRSALWPLRAP
ncbi:MAG: diacylglycerol kinase family protein [Pseudomonadota bacterium]|nr:diacylglycerol kinase family protein [Pseudomonadota bacterium]